MKHLLPYRQIENTAAGGQYLQTPESVQMHAHRSGGGGSDGNTYTTEDLGGWLYQFYRYNLP